jgi:hypothetical protein
MIINKDDIDDETIQYFKNKNYVFESEKAFNLGDLEAMNLPGEYTSNLSIKIETFEVKV